MKLTSFAQPSLVLTEGLVDPMVLITLQRMIARGAPASTFDYLVIGRLTFLMQIGRFWLEPSFLEIYYSTPVEVMNHVRSLPKEQLVSIAKRLLTLSELKDQATFVNLTAPNEQYPTWLQRFTAAEAND